MSTKVSALAFDESQGVNAFIKTFGSGVRLPRQSLDTNNSDFESYKYIFDRGLRSVGSNKQ